MGPKHKQNNLFIHTKDQQKIKEGGNCKNILTPSKNKEQKAD